MNQKWDMAQLVEFAAQRGIKVTELAVGYLIKIPLFDGDQISEYLPYRVDTAQEVHSAAERIWKNDIYRIKTQKCVQSLLKDRSNILAGSMLGQETNMNCS